MNLVIDSKQIKEAMARLEAIGEDLKDEIHDSSTEVGPQWVESLSSRASTVAQKRLLVAGANTVATETGITLNVGRGRLSGGLNTEANYGAVEFGGNRGKALTYSRKNRKSAGKHTVTRRTQRQLQEFDANGRVFIPATKAFIPKLTKAWEQAASDALNTALGGGDG